MTEMPPAPWCALYPESADPDGGTPSTLLAAFEAAVNRPDAPFLHYLGGAISYREAAARVDALAAWLAGAGVGQGDRVALALQNVPDFAIGTLAAWRLGAIAMPINPMYRARELAHLFEDAGPGAVLCHPDHLPVVAVAASAVPRCVVLVSDPRADANAEDTRVLPPITDLPATAVTLAEVYAVTPSDALRPTHPDRDAVALLLYTSGTTGRPKGAEITHANLALSSASAVRWFSLRDRSRVLAMAPLFHITGFTLHLGIALATGGELVLGYRFHPEAMLEAMLRHRPSFSIASITAYFALQAVDTVSPGHFASFDTLATGGAPAPAAAVEAFRARFGRDLLNGYGMTELAGASHFPPPGHAAPIDSESGALSIGVPLFGIDARIVDDEDRDVRPGEVGELLIRGPQVMRGYWRNPGATADALQQGWLRTGDVAKMREDGWFFLVDRKRDMIVASGFKVWPREVEDALYAHPAVHEAAVIGVPDDYRGETVKAVVALKSGASASPDELIAHCRDNLAAYKVPRICEIVPDLPKTLTGKIVRAELRDPVVSPRI
jgi:long-chain acyl-CoA synthetase